MNGDTAGFVAATYLRGVAFIQCPTTLLAMVDSSVGGKTGVNVPQGKNLIGSFYQPKAVVIDPEVLRTLPRRELCCGLAECVKHAVIADDSLFSWIEAKLPQILALEMPVLVELLERNIAIKARIVEQDEKEQGIRAYLNLGHTFGHAIEATAGYGVIEHGEAVALGMIAAFELAVSLGICGCEAAERVRRLIERIGLPVKADLAANEALIAAMASDKKRKDSAVRFVLPERIGAVRIISGAERGSLNAAWDSLR
ncbi:MAG TPA: 3-dehydroquinate synthase [Oligoflexia bacterium]|nr:3-dehydroquinate synthase [Oligoflexia bacterium]